jgi:transposase
MPRAYSVDFRLKVVEKVQNGMSCKNVAILLNIGLNSVQRWVKKYNNGDISPVKRLKTNDRRYDYNLIKVFVDQNPDKTLKQIGEATQISHKTVWYAMKKMGYVRKKTVFICRKMRAKKS